MISIHLKKHDTRSGIYFSFILIAIQKAIKFLNKNIKILREFLL
jgi:hypothetical protein